MAPQVLAHVTLAVLIMSTIEGFVMQRGPRRGPRRPLATALSYKVMGPAAPGSDKPTVLEEGTNKVVTGNLDGSSSRFPRLSRQPKESGSSSSSSSSTSSSSGSSSSSSSTPMSPSMDDLAQEWAARNREVDHSLPQPAMARRATAEPAPTTHQQPRGTTSSKNIGNVAQEWATMQRSPAVKSAPPKPVGPSMEELALMWVEANRNTDSAFVDTPRMGTMTAAAMPTSITKHQPHMPASRTAAEPVAAVPPAGPSMQDLALMWMEANKSTDTYVDTPPIGGGAPVIDVTPLEQVPPETSTAEPAAAAPPPTGPSMQDLALMWMEANRNTDTYIDTPPMGSSVPVISPAPESPPALVAISDSSSTGSSFDSLMETIDDSWKDVTSELDEINREAAQTFQSLQQMESEMNTMIDKIQAQEASHKTKVRQIQDGSFQTEMRLQGQLDSLRSEYGQFRRNAEARHAQAVQSAEEGRALLKGQIDDLKRSLEKKINVAKEESSRAQEYMKKYQETETQLTRAREMHASEMAQVSTSTTERLQDLRRVTQTLRNVSQGSREIMERMRQKFLG